VKRVIGWSSMAMVDRYGHIGHRAIPAFENINEIVVNRWKKSECARRCDT
jgi:hypothetical protein